MNLFGLSFLLCVVVDSELSVLTMCLQISYLKLLHGPQNLSFSELVEEYLYKSIFETFHSSESNNGTL